MKKLLLLSSLFLIVVQFTAKAQITPSVHIDLFANTITINGIQFTRNSTIDDYEKHLGKPDRIEQKRGVDQYFAYDKLGISLSLAKDSEVVNEIFFTYLNDGDRKVASEAYKGVLKVNDKVVQPQTSQKEMSKLMKAEFVEVMNGYFISPTKPLSILLYYPEGTPYTSMKQFGIRFSAMN